MAHEFVILLKGSLYTYDKYEDIPLEFDNVIKFLPEIPEGPHSHDQHEEMDQWVSKLQELLKREKNASSD
jgi:hypothetical protein